jgi:hypothetical protein
MKILFRTYGGLGNQIFQFYYLFCVCRKFSINNIFHHHSTNYDRFAEFEFPVKVKFQEPNFFELLLISLRIPVIARRLLGFKNLGYLRLGKFIIIDGYFQSDFYYMDFSKNILEDSILEIRDCTINGNNKIERRNSLIHLRLGDFFKTEEGERDFVLSCLKNMKVGTDVISNNDTLFFTDVEIKNIMMINKLNYINTSNISSHELYNFFCEYETIISSGSSLSFAACIFNNIRIIPDKNLTDFQQMSFDRMNKLKIYLSRLS